jgi:transcriptional regulator with XRE-family HTH domain
VSLSTRKFGLELQRCLNSRHMMEMDLARNMKAMGNGVSRQYINMIVHNERTPPPETIEKLADGLKLSRDERTILHRAAAIDSGYRIGILR